MTQIIWNKQLSLIPGPWRSIGPSISVRVLLTYYLTCPVGGSIHPKWPCFLIFSPQTAAITTTAATPNLNGCNDIYQRLTVLYYTSFTPLIPLFVSIKKEYIFVSATLTHAVSPGYRTAPIFDESKVIAVLNGIICRFYRGNRTSASTAFKTICCCQY